MQDAGTGAQGDLDSYPGLQPHSHDHGTGGEQAWSRTATISFKGTIQTLEAFQPLIAMQGRHDAAFREHLYQHLLDAVASHRVSDRPHRYEPRRRKRHARKYFTFIKPRHEAKRDMANGVRDK